MDVKELEQTVGEAAFKAMTPEQKTALLGKFAPPPKDEGDKGKKKDDPPQKDEPGLLDKTKKNAQSDDDKKSESARIESAIAFNYTLKEWLKTNKDILPGEIEDVFKISEKEKYDSQIQKANALRDAIIQSFFSVQDNLDLLTANQKRAIDEYLKLTKNGREQKAESVFENYFEPALETMKRVKKAEEVGRARSGFATGSKVEDAYKERLIQGSRKTYLGEK